MLLSGAGRRRTVSISMTLLGLCACAALVYILCVFSSIPMIESRALGSAREIQQLPGMTRSAGREPDVRQFEDRGVEKRKLSAGGWNPALPFFRGHERPRLTAGGGFIGKNIRISMLRAGTPSSPSAVNHRRQTRSRKLARSPPARRPEHHTLQAMATAEVLQGRRGLRNARNFLSVSSPSDKNHGYRTLTGDDFEGRFERSPPNPGSAPAPADWHPGPDDCPTMARPSVPPPA